MRLMSQPTWVVCGSRSATSRSAPMRKTPPGLAAEALADGAWEGTGTAAPEELAAGFADAGAAAEGEAGAEAEAEGAADGAGAQACRAMAMATMSAGVFRASVLFMSSTPPVEPSGCQV